MLADITEHGSVLLGDHLVCDGYHSKCKVRIQSHIHQDHMYEFNRSKGEQTIYLTNASRDLLICTENADIPVRRNIIGLDYGEERDENGVRFKLVNSGHMLGSAQIQVIYPSGESMGYSGDFSWPLDEIIEVDTLILDSTCGGINKRREFTQEEASARFVEVVFSKINEGPVFVKAHRGTLQRVIGDLSMELNLDTIPVLASNLACKEVDVYKRHGLDLPNMIEVGTDQAKSIISTENKYIRLFRPKERIAQTGKCSIINCSRHLSDPIDPVCVHNERSFTVSLSDHADFYGTLEYIKHTKAKRVITDNTRGGYAIELAHNIRSLLNVDSQPSSNVADIR